VAGDLHRGIEDAVLRQLKGVLTGDEAAMQAPAHHPVSLTVIRPGEAAGRLLGGCLSLFVCSIGTPFQPDLYDTILFLEDRNERYYAIDRMLTYLKLCGAFEGVRGLVFGCIDPMPADRHHPYDVVDVIADVLGDLTDSLRLSGRPLSTGANAAIWCRSRDPSEPPGVVGLCRCAIIQRPPNRVNRAAP
jgi:muramoyltetrapeptide carboxypeptidase